MDEDLKMVDEDAPKVDERESRELFSLFSSLGMG
jgi:hypothetical protein